MTEAPEQTRLWRAKEHHEVRILLREILANHGPLPTSAVAALARMPMRRTCVKLDWMVLARMVKRVGLHRNGRTRGETVWALRCYPDAAYHQARKRDPEQHERR